MNSKHTLVFGIALSAALLFSGCIKKNRIAAPLGLPKSVGIEKNGIEVKAARMNRVEVEHTFGTRFPRGRAFEMVHLSIANKTNHACLLDTKNINLDIETVGRVGKRIQHNILGYTLGFGIPGATFIAVVFAVPVISAPLLALGIYGLSAAGIYGYDAGAENIRLYNDLKARMLSKDSLHWVYPHEILNKVMFIEKKNFRSSFGFSLVCEPDSKIETFTIDLR